MKCNKPRGQRTCLSIETVESGGKSYYCPNLKTCPVLLKSAYDNYRSMVRKFGDVVEKPNFVKAHQGGVA